MAGSNMRVTVDFVGGGPGFACERALAGNGQGTNQKTRRPLMYMQILSSEESR